MMKVLILAASVILGACDKASDPNKSATGKSKPPKGQVTEEPQLLFDAKTGKSEPLTWAPWGQKLTLEIDASENTPGVWSVAVVVKTKDGDSDRSTSYHLEGARGDRIEAMIRYESNPRVGEVLHIVAIEGGTPGKTTVRKSYVDPVDEDFELSRRGFDEKPGVFYPPVKKHYDSLRFTTMDVEDSHGCGIRPDGSVACWGDGFEEISRVPKGKFTMVSVNVNRSCGLREDKTIACWGTSGDEAPPKGTFSDIALGHSFICGTTTEGQTRCWPRQKPREKLPTKTTANRLLANVMDHQGATDAPEGDFISVKAEYSIRCGLLRDGSIKCWGGDMDGLVSQVPKGRFTEIALSTNLACAIANDGAVSCWGDEAESQPPKGRYTQLSVGAYHACAIATDNSLLCWGDNGSNQLDVPKGSYTYVAAGGSYTCAINTDQSVACWGATRYHGKGGSPSLRLPLF